MIFAILLILKLLPFMNITNVEHNRMIIFSISALIILFIFSLIHFTNLKRKRIIGFIIYGIISLIMFVDVMYFSYFNSLPSIKMVKMVGEAAAAGDSVKSLFTMRNLLFLIDIPFLMIYSKWKKKQIEEENRNYNKYMRWGVPISIALVLVLA